MESSSTSEDRTLWTDRLSRAVSRLREVSASRSVRVGGFLVALPLFGGALFLAWSRADFSLSEIASMPVLVVVAAVPLTIFASTWQLRASALAVGTRIRWWNAFRVTTLGTLSGLLPISSTTVVRAGAVVYWGVSPGATGRVLAFDAIVWICTSLLYSGGAAFLLGASELAMAMAATGLVLVPVAAVLGRGLANRRGRFELVAARLTGMLVQVIRLQACFLALGYSITFIEASTLAAASPVASLFFFLPGGLGVREGFTSIVAAVIDLSAAGAFLAATLNRLVGLSVLLTWEAALLVRLRLRSGEDAEWPSKKTSG